MGAEVKKGETEEQKGRWAGIDEVSNIFNKALDFKNEKEMGNYIELNIEAFCLEVLHDKYIKHTREFPISKKYSKNNGHFMRGRHNTRVDFLIECSDCTHAIELKNPLNDTFTKMCNVLGQVMMYDTRLAEMGIDAQLVVVSTRFEEFVSHMIFRFNLPFIYIVFNKQGSAAYGKRNTN